MKTRLVCNILRSPLARSMCFVLFITTFTSWCLAFPVSYDDSLSLAKKDEVKTMIGESQESVIRKLRLPDQWVSQGDRQFMTYSAASSSQVVVIFFLTPLLIPGGGVFRDSTLHCYGIEIDSNNMVKNYKIGSSNQSCRNLLTNDWELPNLEIRAMRNIPTQSVYARTNHYGFLEESGFINSLYQFKEGDLISMTTNKEITIASTKVTSLKIAVVESDSTKIKGRLSGFLSYVDETMENEVGSIIEIMREDVENIWIEEIRP